MPRSFRPRALAPVAALVAVLLLLAGCGSGDDSSKVSSTPPADLVVKVLKAGTGATVAADDTITVDYQGSNFRTGKVFDQSYGKTPATLPLRQFVPGFGGALVGQKVGAQVLLSIPPALGYGTTGNEGAGIKGTDTIVFAVEIKATEPTKTPALSCDVKAGKASGAVKVTGKNGAVPKIEVAKSVKATKLERTVLTPGKGAATKADEIVSARLTIFNPRTGKKLQSQAGQIQVGSTQNPPYIAAGVDCVKVGARVVTTTPAKLAITAATADVKLTDTIVTVIDITKIDPAPAKADLPKVKEWTNAPKVTFNGTNPPVVELPAAAK